MLCKSIEARWSDHYTEQASSRRPHSSEVMGSRDQCSSRSWCQERRSLGPCDRRGPRRTPVGILLYLRNRSFRRGDGLARIGSEMEVEGKQRDRLPNGRRIGLITTHEGCPQLVSPFRNVTDDPPYRFYAVPSAEIVSRIFLLRFPSPLEPGDQLLDARAEGGRLVNTPQHLAVILEDIPARAHGLEVQALHALISFTLGMIIVTVVEPMLAGQPARHLRVGQRRKEADHCHRDCSSLDEVGHRPRDRSGFAVEP